MKKETVVIHGDHVKLKDIKSSIDSCRARKWIKQIWTPRPALIYKESKHVEQFRGQEYDPKDANLYEKGWDHEHCEICFWTISEKEDKKAGYADKNDNWLCTECYTQFIEKWLNE